MTPNPQALDSRRTVVPLPVPLIEDQLRTLCRWQTREERTTELLVVVSRILLQDFTGVPLLCDLAAMRETARRFGRPPGIIEPRVPVDLVIDHSVQVDHHREPDALDLNMALEFARNGERYRFLEWGMQAFERLRIVPPGVGIVHQVSLERLAPGAQLLGRLRPGRHRHRSGADADRAAAPGRRRRAVRRVLRRRCVDADAARLRHGGQHGARVRRHGGLLAARRGGRRLPAGHRAQRGAGKTLLQPEVRLRTIHEAAMRYRRAGTPSVVVAGLDYGSGSSRDWAAKGTRLLGVRAVLARSYERIHRSNLVGMGVLPLQFAPGDSAGSLGLRGDESLGLLIPDDGPRRGQDVTVRITRADGTRRDVELKLRIDTPAEEAIFADGGLLPHLMRRLLRSTPEAS